MQAYHLFLMVLMMITGSLNTIVTKFEPPSLHAAAPLPARETLSIPQALGGALMWVGHVAPGTTKLFCEPPMRTGKLEKPYAVRQRCPA